jgi:DNA polymerase
VSSATEKLKKMHDRIRRCTECRLHESRTHAVAGDGNFRAPVMIIGEAPGAQEDRVGKPFVGRSGEYLDARLDDWEIGRDDVFITSVVKCRPPNNRNPRADERRTCVDLWLHRQIELVDPEIIILIGGVAIEGVLGDTGALRDLHGQERERDGRRYLLTYHPAAAMRFPEPDEKMCEDFRQFRPLVMEAMDRSR